MITPSRRSYNAYVITTIRSSSTDIVALVVAVVSKELYKIHSSLSVVVVVVSGSTNTQKTFSSPSDQKRIFIEPIFSPLFLECLSWKKEGQDCRLYRCCSEFYLQSHSIASDSCANSISHSGTSNGKRRASKMLP